MRRYRYTPRFMAWSYAVGAIVTVILTFGWHWPTDIAVLAPPIALALSAWYRWRYERFVSSRIELHGDAERHAAEILRRRGKAQ